MRIFCLPVIAFVVGFLPLRSFGFGEFSGVYQVTKTAEIRHRPFRFTVFSAFQESDGQLAVLEEVCLPPSEEVRREFFPQGLTWRNAWGCPFKVKFYLHSGVFENYAWDTIFSGPQGLSPIGPKGSTPSVYGDRVWEEMAQCFDFKTQKNLVVFYRGGAPSEPKFIVELPVSTELTSHLTGRAKGRKTISVQILNRIYINDDLGALSKSQSYESRVDESKGERTFSILSRRYGADSLNCIPSGYFPLSSEYPTQ